MVLLPAIFHLVYQDFKHIGFVILGIVSIVIINTFLGMKAHNSMQYYAVFEIVIVHSPGTVKTCANQS